MPCVQYMPLFEEVAEFITENNELKDKVIMASCNVETFFELASSLGIRSIPTTHFSFSRIEIHRFSGVIDPQSLLNEIRKISEFAFRNKEQILKEKLTRTKKFIWWETT